jgi:competence protein ComEC
MSGADISASDPPDDAGRRGGREGAYESTTTRSYDAGRHEDWHPANPILQSRSPGTQRSISDLGIVVLATTTTIGVWSGSAAVAGLAALAAALCIRSARLVLLAVVLASFGAVRSQHAWNGLTPDDLGPFAGWVRLVADPQPYASSTRVLVEVDGERYEAWSRGRSQQRRVATWRAGEWVEVSGTRVELQPDRSGRVAWQHVVGEFELEWASDIDPGAPVALASNRVRSTIERGASWLPDPYAALFRGLVIGDDRDQPGDMVDRFRASGLSHLTAVSGQNVSFLLAACGPLLVRLRPRARWLVTTALIAWFVTLTRFEPSILRAGTMAALSAMAFATGRERSPLRILALAVLALVLIDPLLVWSVGFWLSVGATAGVCAIGPRLAKRFDRLGPLAVPLGVALGAQVGVALPSLLVFGRLPLVSVPANLLAVPVAGFVMLYGIPAALLAGWLPVLAPVLMFPALVGTKWIDTVARLGERLEPDAPWVWLGWAAIVVAICVVVALVRQDRRPSSDASLLGGGKNRRRHDHASAHR